MTKAQAGIPQDLHQVERMQKYYQFHAKIYDLTRWSFLFGREAIIKHALDANPECRSILEVGCGTGHNLSLLAQHFTKAKIIGLDVSAQMLEKARENTEPYQAQLVLEEQAYERGNFSWTGKLDMILFSYSLSMINPFWKELLEQAHKDLRPGGIIAVVDFHDSPLGWFKSHMGNNHVRMDAHIVPVLKELFQTEFEEISGAYLGLWKYFRFVGIKA